MVDKGKQESNRMTFTVRDGGAGKPADVVADPVAAKLTSFSKDKPPKATETKEDTDAS